MKLFIMGAIAYNLNHTVTCALQYCATDGTWII